MRRYYYFILALAALVFACEPAPKPASQQQAVAASLRTGAVAPAQSTWARSRIVTISGIWNIKLEGRAWMESYDLRQMPGQPGWFGSHGNGGWAGAGQARPTSVLHEMMHSYWGAFGVTGQPELSWKASLADTPAPAMLQYRRDLETFMRQPPDRFEPLRERFRNFPNLSRGDYPDLYHFGEADLVQGVGGNLNLLPPILRKYYDRFLEPGPFEDWLDAISWYLGLPPDRRHYADLYIGMSNIPMQPYMGLRPEQPTSLPLSIPELAQGEERQRLLDFADQFDLIKQNQFSLVDAAQVDRGFHFWRWYLAEAKELYRRFPDVLTEQTGAGGQRLAGVFDIYIAAEGMPTDRRVEYLKERFAADPELLDFSALLPGQALVQLFAGAPAPSDANSAEAVTRLYTGKLVHYTQLADGILTTARKDREEGARALQALFSGMSDDALTAEMGLVFDLLRDGDVELTRTITNLMNDDVVLRLIWRNAGVARNDNVSPERLAAALRIHPDTPLKELVAGIRGVMGATSGNFEIDAPMTDILYRVIADVGARHPVDGLAVLEQTRMPLLPFIRKYPHVAGQLFSAAPERFAALVAAAGTNDYGNTPWRIIHGTIAADPELAASIVLQLDAQGRTDIASEAVIVFAFDADRTSKIPEVPLSVVNDGRFLDRLLSTRGTEWLTRTMTHAVAAYATAVRDGSMDPLFVQEYRRTLRGALHGLAPESRDRLEEAFRSAFAAAKEVW